MPPPRISVNQFLKSRKGYKQHKISWIKYSNIEVYDLLKAWIAISLAFAIAFVGLNKTLLMGIPVALVVVGTAFLFHELAHKVVAQKYKYPAEFRAFDEMLFLALIMSFFGFVIAAPGAVMIGGTRMNKRKNGKISMAGPLTNIILAFVFFLIFTFLWPSAHEFVIRNWSIPTILIKVNGFIGLFNLIPVWLFDGAKIFKWNKLVHISMVVLAAYAAFFL